MGGIFLGIPIAIFIIFSIFIFVKFSDSNKHLDNMDTQSKLELERLRKEVIDKIKNKNINSSETESNYEQLMSEVKKNQKETSELQNIIKNYHNKKYEYVENKKEESFSNRLSFNKDNLVRGLIAKEYLDRKKR
ncbi:hypothetical protein [Gemelliphila palaticanis]|uniref:Uncharacterized protein n=1 Tax=Gemelliphila palaticanis TaxID=81950 RepID=A0ABX2SY14_9BACL|nr:hypothetical protein [Gemella palaticanis]MBF0714922.1 hypothetical protein [Gemella palaticanis]NYS46852.1 hypothetical protein [Gemella palaticanis]